MNDKEREYVERTLKQCIELTRMYTTILCGVRQLEKQVDQLIRDNESAKKARAVKFTVSKGLR